MLTIQKLDEIGPVDYTPFTNKLHHFVKKINIKKIKITFDT